MIIVDDNRTLMCHPVTTSVSLLPTRFGFQAPTAIENWVYAFNPCYDFSDAYCTNVIVSMKSRAFDYKIK